MSAKVEDKSSSWFVLKKSIVGSRRSSTRSSSAPQMTDRMDFLKDLV